MRMFATTFKIVVEPTGCLGMAAVRSLAGQLPGRRIGVIVSGGNVDLAAACRALTAPEREIEPSAAEPGRP
jgi:threonine dehydratase